MDSPQQQSGPMGLRMPVAVAIGAAGAVVIWVAALYNNHIIGVGFISDSYLPVAALFLMLVLVLGVNPLLRLIRRRLALDRRQLVIILGMFLTASVLPGQGLMRGLPNSLANVPLRARADKRLAEAYERANLPACLFPDRVAYNAETPASEYFVNELPKGRPVPWSAWLGPLVSWGSFLVAAWLMMAGLALIVLPQWRENERLSFPLLALQESLIEEPAEGLFAPIFRRRSFWIGAGAVFLLYLLYGLKVYNPEGVPAIPLQWDLSRLFTEEPLLHLPGHIYQGRLYFLFVGIAFFMPNRVGFSIWFFVVAYAVYRVIGRSYFPPFDDWGAFADHRSAAMVVITIAILYLGRRHWANVFATLVTRARSDEDRRDRRAAIMFLAGCGGMFAFLVWVGMGAAWALFYVGFAFMVSILITRIVAETGMPFIRIDAGYKTPFVRLMPLNLLNPVAVYFSGIMAIVFTMGSRVSFATMATHAIGLDRDAAPRRQSRLALGLVVLLAIGLVVCGAAHLYFSYHHSMTLDGSQQPICAWGVGLVNISHGDLVKLVDAYKATAKPGAKPITYPFQATYDRWAHLAFAAALTAGLLWLCMHVPKWPLHPIGLLMINTFFGNEAWVSVLVGWLLKVLILRYGGAGLYRKARPLFFGLIVGQVLAGIFWSLEPAARVLLGLRYEAVWVNPR